MIEGDKPVLSVPSLNIKRHRVWQIDRENLGASDIAGPFFDAGGLCAAIAVLPDYRGDLHIPACHRFYLMLQGKMKVRLGRDIILAQPGDLVCMPAGVMTSRTGIGPIEVIYIALADTPLWAPLKTLGRPVRKYESTDLLYILVARLTGALASQDVYSKKCARENSEMLVTLLKREMHQSTNEWASSRMKRLAELIESIRKQPDRKWTQAVMARSVNMSERNLSRVFHRVFNMPPSRMVITIRMDIASRLLVNTDMPLSAIANAVGYESPFSFSRLFRKYTGISPDHYRKLPAGKRHDVMSGSLAEDIQSSEISCDFYEEAASAPASEITSGPSED